MKTIFSGIQPSGIIHIGNYLGAIKNWIQLQDEYSCIFSIVDYHAITIPQDPQDLKENIAKIAAIYLAAGIDPQKSIIFIQSQVSAHTELCWILNCITYTGELERMTQYKEKKLQVTSYKLQNSPSIGLFDYPVLMAADILLYQTNLVPVGEDQKQHIELARDLAQRFNNNFGETFVIPEPLIKKEGGRIMGLDNPTQKMSKSAASPNNYIALTDLPETIREKIKKAVTDSGKEIKYDEENKPAISNLLTIYSLLAEKSIQEIEKQYENANGYTEFKDNLAEIVIEKLNPFQEKYQELIDNPSYLHEILKTGREKAEIIAQKTLSEVKTKMGLL